MTHSSPGPKGISGAMTPPLLFLDPLRTLKRLSGRFGDAVRVELLGRDTWIFARPEFVKHVLVVGAEDYGKSSLNRQLSAVLGDGLITAEGATWRDHRDAIHDIFSRRRLTALAEIMAREAREYLDETGKTAFDSGRIALEPQLADFTLRLFCCSLLGSERAADMAEFRRISDKLFPRVSTRLTLSPLLPQWASKLHDIGIRPLLNRLDGFLYRTIEAAESQPARPNSLMAALMELYRHGQTEADRRQLRDEICTFMFAGHETAATTLCWALLHTMNDPAVSRALTEEADQVGEERPEAAVDPEAFPLARAFLGEIMRLYPPVWRIARQALRDDAVGGHQVKKGDLVLLPLYLIQRDQRYWTRPDEFDMGRFASKESGARVPFSYLPFGAGPRVCIGGQFAVTMMILALTMILRRFRMELVTAGPIAPRAMLTLRPNRTILVRFHPRQEA